MSMPNQVVCRRCHAQAGYACRDLAWGEPAFPMAIYHKVRIEDAAKENQMAFPKNSDELKAAGYIFSNDATCRACGDEIEWWETPAGKPMPFNPMTQGSSLAIAHFKTCSDKR